MTRYNFLTGWRQLSLKRLNQNTLEVHFVIASSGRSVCWGVAWKTLSDKTVALSSHQAPLSFFSCHSSRWTPTSQTVSCKLLTLSIIRPRVSRDLRCMQIYITYRVTHRQYLLSIVRSYCRPPTIRSLEIKQGHSLYVPFRMFSHYRKLMKSTPAGILGWFWYFV